MLTLKKVNIPILLFSMLFVLQFVGAEPSLNQAAYQGGNIYKFGYRSIPNTKIKNAPVDTDWIRWAMLHDGSTYPVVCQLMLNI